MQENKQLWMTRLTVPESVVDETKKTVVINEGTSSFSTVRSADEGRKSEGGTSPMPWIPTGDVVNNGTSPSGDDQKTRIRKEKSFSSLIFWRKKGRQQRLWES